MDEQRRAARPPPSRSLAVDGDGYLYATRPPSQGTSGPRGPSARTRERENTPSRALFPPRHLPLRSDDALRFGRGGRARPRGRVVPRRPGAGHRHLPGATMQRPLLLEGEAGVGKTEVAKTLARILGAELVRLQCYEGIDAARRSTSGTTRASSCTRGRSRPARSTPAPASPSSTAPVPPRAAAAERDPHRAGAVLLIDELDRADDEFEAFLLEVLSTTRSPCPSSGRSRAAIRRPSWSRPTGRGSSTTRSSGAASTTGSAFPTWSARSRSSGAGARGLRAARASVAETVARLRGSTRQAPGAARRSTGRARFAARRGGGRRRRTRAGRSAGRSRTGGPAPGGLACPSGAA